MYLKADKRLLLIDYGQKYVVSHCLQYDRSMRLWVKETLVHDTVHNTVHNTVHATGA